MNAQLLIVDDEERLRLSLQEYFEREGFTVTAAADGEESLQKAFAQPPDLFILDVHLPDQDGLEVCRALRRQFGQAVRVIMLSGVKKELIDRVVGLELGADVYVTKPFETRELLAQARALLRQRQAALPSGTDTGWLIIDDFLQVHFEKRQVQAGGQRVHLTPLEFDLLRYLMEKPGLPCGRADLIDAVWGYEAGGDISDGAVNTCVAKLRAKLEPDPAHPSYILSVHGIGYRFKEIGD
ncbi:MAG TPA: response regulator transcription factor [Anaerolineales bacterium]|nr:response regulator transcription factor [Anaerolineales bacterium]